MSLIALCKPWIDIGDIAACVVACITNVTLPQGVQFCEIRVWFVLLLDELEYIVSTVRQKAALADVIELSLLGERRFGCAGMDPDQIVHFGKQRTTVFILCCFPEDIATMIDDVCNVVDQQQHQQQEQTGSANKCQFVEVSSLMPFVFANINLTTIAPLSLQYVPMSDDDWQRELITVQFVTEIFRDVIK